MSEKKSLTYVEIDIPFCTRTYGVAPCAARLSTDDDPVAVTFDATNDVLKRGAGLTGAADGKLGTLSLWFRRDTAPGDHIFFTGVTTLNGATFRFLVYADNTNKVFILGLDSSGSTVLSVRTSALALSAWHHVLLSFDLSNVAKRHLYVDDVSDLTVTTFVNTNIDYTLADWGVGAYPSGLGKLGGSLADLWFAHDTYIDFSVQANRRKFITASGGPVSLGATGNLPTGSAPIVYLGNPLATWHTNRGTGGGFTLTGTLEEAEFATGTIKCFNSTATCQSRSSLLTSDVTLRFGKQASYLPAGIDCIPSIVDATISPGTIKPGESLGERSTLTVTFRDGYHPDTGPGYDKYRTERNYDPVAQGTYWGKLRARQPYLRGLKIRLRQGYLGQSLEEMETRHFFIESYNGPVMAGTFTIEAKDIFKQLDGDRAMAPEMSNGFLLGDIDSDDMAFTLSPSGIGNAEYDASGYLAIGGKEIVAFTRSGDTVTITARARFNTEAQAHKAQDRVQTVLYIFGQDVSEILKMLWEDYAGVSEDYIPIDEWLVETEGFLGTVYTAAIAEPTPVRKLSDELIEQAALCVWWDDLAALVRLTVLRAILTDAALFDEHNRKKDSILSVKDQPDKRISQVWTYYAQINPLKALDDLDNYRSTAVTIDGEAETNHGSSAIKVVTSRWIPELARAVAQKLNNKLLARFRTAPRAFGFATMRYSDSDVELGRGYNLGSHLFQDATGARVNVPIQVIRLLPAPDRFIVEAEEMRFLSLTDDVPSHLCIVDANSFNINLRTLHDSQYPEAISGDTVTLVINVGVTVGSTSPAVPALNIGSWAAGVIVEVIINGEARGAGGLGGLGGNSSGDSGDPGSVGGIALYTRYPINLSYPPGSKIWSGGGGGGGGGAGTGPGFVPGAGGGGGGGISPGPPGPGSVGPGGPSAPGSAGTPNAGGLGGPPSPPGPINSGGGGGPGGGPGAPGSAGTGGGGGSSPGLGGAAGAAIDGISFVSVIMSGGSILGPTVN